MGGCLAITLREKDGREFRMSRWTNASPFLIDNIDLINGSDHIQKYLIEPWLKETKKPDDQRSWSFNHPYLAPSEYGLVVIDFMHNKLLDLNDYHGFGRCQSLNLYNESCATQIDDMGITWGVGEKLGIRAFLEDDGNEASRFYKFHKAGRIKAVQKFDPVWLRYVDTGVDINGWDFEKVYKEYIEIMAERDYSKEHCFLLDMSPLELVSLRGTFDSYRNFHQQILDLGFVLSDEEEEIWEEKFRSYEEEE